MTIFSKKDYMQKLDLSWSQKLWKWIRKK